MDIYSAEYVFSMNMYSIIQKGGEKMKKGMIILVLTTLMAVILCGAASAAENSSTTGDGGNLWVNVYYEYDDDIINPEINIKDSHNNSVAFEKTKKLTYSTN